MDLIQGKPGLLFIKGFVPMCLVSFVITSGYLKAQLYYLRLKGDFIFNAFAIELQRKA